MAYLSEPLLADAWNSLFDRLIKIDIPIALWRSSQNPAKPFLDVHDKWSERLFSKYDERGNVVRPFTVRDLEEWSAALAQQQTFVGTLEANYPQRAERPQRPQGPVRSGAEIEIFGDLPWWYWPFRIGAGIGAGYLVFRVLRPQRRELDL